MNDDDGAGGSSKSNSITSEHSLQSTGISASSQGSSTNSLPKGVPIPQGGGATSGGHQGHHVIQGQPDIRLDQSHHEQHHYSNTPTRYGFT